MDNAINTVPALTVGARVRVSKGCKPRDIAKNVSATITEIAELGAEYGHSVRVVLQFRNGFMAGKSVRLYARHINRLGDIEVSLNDGRPEHTVRVVRS